MGCYTFFVLVAYLALLQWDAYQSAPVQRCTNSQLRVPLNCIDWFPLCCYPTPCCSYQYYTNQQKNCYNRKVRPNDIKISIPTATKSGKTNIIIENRQLPKEKPNCNCKIQANDKTKVNVIVEFKNKKGKESDCPKNYSSRNSSIEPSAINDKSVIESEFPTKSQPTSHDDEVPVNENVDKFDEDNKDTNTNRIESNNESKINTIIENSNIAVINNNDSVITADTSTDLRDTIETESSGVISDSDIRLGEDDITEAGLNSGSTSTDVIATTDSSTSITENSYTTDKGTSTSTISDHNAGETIYTSETNNVVDTASKSSDSIVTDNFAATVVDFKDDSIDNDDTIAEEDGTNTTSDVVTVDDNPFPSNSETTGGSDVANSNDDNAVTDVNNNGGSETNNIDATITGSETTEDGTEGEAIGNYGAVAEISNSVTTSRTVITNDSSVSSNDNTSEEFSGSGGIIIDEAVGTSSSTSDTDNQSDVATENITVANKGISGITTPSSEVTSENISANTNSATIVTDNEANIATDINESVFNSRDIAIDKTVGTSSTTTGADEDSAIISISKGISSITEPNSDAIIEDEAGNIISVNTVTSGDDDDNTTVDINSIIGSVTNAGDIASDKIVGTSSTTDVVEDIPIATEHDTSFNRDISDITEPSPDATSEGDTVNTISVHTVITGNDNNLPADINGISGSVSNAGDITLDKTVDTSSSIIDVVKDIAIATEQNTSINRDISDITEPSSDATSEDDTVNTISVNTVITGDDDNIATDINGIGGTVSSAGNITLDKTVDTSSLTTDEVKDIAIATEHETSFSGDISDIKEPSSDATSEDDTVNTNSGNVTGDNTGSVMDTSIDNSDLNDFSETTSTSGSTGLSDDIKSSTGDENLTNSDAVEKESITSTAIGSDETNTAEHEAAVNTDGENKDNVAEVEYTSELISSNDESLPDPASDKVHQAFWSKHKKSHLNRTGVAATNKNDITDTTDKKNKSSITNNDSTNDDKNSARELSTAAITDSTAETNTDDGNDENDDKIYT